MRRNPRRLSGVTSIRGRLATQLVRVIGLKRRLQRLAGLTEDPAAFEEALRGLRRTDRRRPPWTVRRRWSGERIDVAGFDLWLMTPTGEGRSERVLLYLHGGGYLFGPFGTEWSAMRTIAAESGSDFAMLLYPRAPEHDAATTLRVTRVAYAELTARYGAGRVVPVGTSAGGGLAVSLMAVLRDDADPQPPCAVLLSPGVDMTLLHDVSPYEETDVLLSVAHVRSAGEIYAGALGAAHPIVSPVFGDLSRLPRMHVFVGGVELLRPGIEWFAERAFAAGTDVRLTIGDHEQHTWPIAPTPEGRIALRQIVDIVGRAG